MSTGKPVIATNVGGCREAFEDEISGFLVPAKNPVALADKILMLAKSRNLREEIGSEARCRVERMFEIRDKVRQTEKLYYQVL
jgi:glycosyltransferase involved in cell wall biosynthesis